MSDEIKDLTLDIGNQLVGLAGKTAEALVEDSKDILESSVENSADRVKELSEDVLAWRMKAVTEKDEELKARYEHEYAVAEAALATRMVSEKRVADTAAREAFMARFKAFSDAALEIGKVALKAGGKIALNSVSGGVGGELAGAILNKI